MSDFEEVSKAKEANFTDVHPSPSSKGKDKMVSGKDLPDFQGTKGDESRWKHCNQCGWLIDLSAVNRGSGRGNETFDTVSGSNYTSPHDPVVTIGCPFCGASEF